MVNQIRNRDGNRQNLRRNNGFRDQWRVVQDRAAISHNRVAEQKPGQKTAEEENGKTVGSGFRAQTDRRNDGEDEGVADERYQGMNDRPEEATDRPDVAVLQI